MGSKRVRLLSLDTAFVAAVACRVHEVEPDVTYSIEAESDRGLRDGLVEPVDFGFSFRAVSSESPSSTATQTETTAA